MKKNFFKFKKFSPDFWMEVAVIACWGLGNTAKIFGLEKKQSKCQLFMMIFAYCSYCYFLNCIHEVLSRLKLVKSKMFICIQVIVMYQMHVHEYQSVLK